jgi:hypothetical protein
MECIFVLETELTGNIFEFETNFYFSSLEHAISGFKQLQETNTVRFLGIGKRRLNTLDTDYEEYFTEKDLADKLGED